MTYIVLGAGIAGTTAAETIRNLDPTAQVILITNEEVPLYSRITLASYAAGIVQREHLLLRKKEQLEAKGITFLAGYHVTAIKRVEHIICIEDMEHTELKLSYDKLLIATGGRPHTLDIPNANGKGIFYMHNLKDGDQIASAIKGKQKGIIIGGAFISIDFITIFLEHNVHIDLLIRGERFMRNMLDFRSSEIIHTLLESKGVVIHTNEYPTSFILDGADTIKGIITNKEQLACDIVGIGIGINRLTPFIKESTLPTNKGVIANEYLQTTDPAIFVAGDVAEYYNIYSKSYHNAGDWLSARNQGQTVAKTMTGKPTIYAEIPSNTSNMFGTNVTILGNIPDLESKESFIQEEGMVYKRIYTENGLIQGALIIGDPMYESRVKESIKAKKRVTSIDL